MSGFIAGRRIEFGPGTRDVRLCFGVARAPSLAKIRGLKPQIPRREYLDGWKPCPLDHQKVKVPTLPQQTRQGWGNPSQPPLQINSRPSSGGLMLGQSIPTGNVTKKSAA